MLINSKDISKYLKDLRESKGLSTRQVAYLTGISNGFISLIERGLRVPSEDVLKALAKAYNVDYLDLYKRANLLVNVNKTTIKVYGTIPAGIPMECIEDIVDTEEITEDMLNGDREYFGLKIKGDSMYPEYLDGDIIILEKVADAESGSDCVVMVNGEDGTFKRIYKTESGIILQPLNSSYQPLNFTNDEIIKLPVKIIGKVVELRRKK